LEAGAPPPPFGWRVLETEPAAEDLGSDSGRDDDGRLVAAAADDALSDEELLDLDDAGTTGRLPPSVTSCQVSARVLFGASTFDGVMTRALNLLYRAHGGSGLGLTRNDVLAMPMRELIWWERNFDRRLKANQRAIEKAQEKAKREAQTRRT
jgi:hypothetical protein